MFNFLKKFSSKKNQAEDPKSSLSQIKTSMNNLREKSTALSSSYVQEKEKIQEIAVTVNELLPENNPTALKFEHNILEKVTTVHYSCSQAIIGKNADEFKKDVAMLEHAVKQRLVFEK